MAINKMGTKEYFLNKLYHLEPSAQGRLEGDLKKYGVTNIIQPV